MNLEFFWENIALKINDGSVTYLKRLDYVCQNIFLDFAIWWIRNKYRVREINIFNPLEKTVQSKYLE